MKALSQVIGTGTCKVLEVPVPAVEAGSLLVRTGASLISTGTETTLLSFGRSNLLAKARSQPERVKQVLNKASTEGWAPTLEAVRDKLGDTIVPGYCNAGVVLEGAGPESAFVPGDRVATNGPHAEIVRVPANLAARIPDGVDYEAAAFTPLAAIALQGLRLAEPTLGETVVVFGLGLVGQLAVQLVRAHGCECIGIDIDPDRVRLAEAFGATGVTADGNVVSAVMDLTRGIGADAVLMTLATDSDEPMRQAAQMSRKRGRIILVGVTGLNLQRSDFFEKELLFRVSCSYGPGRYDRAYEDLGRDYPLPFVRWTEQRNFEAVLGLMANGALDTARLVSHRFPIASGADAYDLLVSDAPALGIVLTYPEAGATIEAGAATVRLRPPEVVPPAAGVLGVLGAGNFARRVLIPAARAAGLQIRTVVSSTGVSAVIEGRRSDAALASSDVAAVIDDPSIDSVLVLTRHDSHAALAARALRAGKHVFVEKPLALSALELAEVQSAAEAAGRILTVGFNRRFAPLAGELRSLLAGRTGPLSLVLTVNAGHVDRKHWVQDPNVGGGRIVGEGCHFIDLCRFLAGAPIRDLSVRSARDDRGRIDDVSHILLEFEDGSTAAIHYLSTGSSRYPKERVEAFFDGKTAAILNWRRLRTWGCGHRDRLLARRMDKGHGAELEAFAAAVRGEGQWPIPMEELFEVSAWSVRAGERARGAGDSDG